jgi:hypothetical protein
VKDVDRENIVIAKNKNQVGELFHLSSVWSWREVKEPTKQSTAAACNYRARHSSMKSQAPGRSSPKPKDPSIRWLAFLHRTDERSSNDRHNDEHRTTRAGPASKHADPRRDARSSPCRGHYNAPRGRGQYP